MTKQIAFAGLALLTTLLDTRGLVGDDKAQAAGPRPPGAVRVISHSQNGKAYAVTDGADNTLWVRDYTEKDTGKWKVIGHCAGAKLGAGKDFLFCATADKRLWVRTAGEKDVSWVVLGECPGDTLACSNGLVFTASADHKLWARPQSDEKAEWTHVGHCAASATLTSYGDSLHCTVITESTVDTWARPASMKAVNWQLLHTVPRPVVVVAVPQPGKVPGVAGARQEVQLERTPAAPGATTGDKYYVTNFGKQTIIVTVRSKRGNEKQSVTEYTLFPGASEFVGYEGWQVTTSYDINAARYK